MNLGAIESELYRRLGLPATPVTATTTRLRAFVNDTLQEVLGEPGIASALDRNEPAYVLATVANQAVYGLNIPRILGIRNLTNDTKLSVLQHDAYRALEPDPTSTTGTPSHWVPLGFSAVAVQPSLAAELFVISTAAGDGAGTTAFIEGIRTGGYPKSLSVAMNGVTGVSLSALFPDFVQVTKFYVSAAAVGTITLRQSSGAGTVLATIPIGQTLTPYQSIALWPTPSGVITYAVDSDREVPDMANATDEPPWPRRFHRILVEGALWREFVKTDDDRRAGQEKRYYRALALMRFFLTCPPDFLPSRGRGSAGRSRFGDNFAAGAGGDGLSGFFPDPYY